jgi:hypothetical protein
MEQRNLFHDFLSSSKFEGRLPLERKRSSTGKIGSLRMGGREIVLPRPPFQVLRCFLNNLGRVCGMCTGIVFEPDVHARWKIVETTYIFDNVFDHKLACGIREGCSRAPGIK